MDTTQQLSSIAWRVWAKAHKTLQAILLLSKKLYFLRIVPLS